MTQIEFSATMHSSRPPSEVIVRLCQLVGSNGISAIQVAENQADFRRGSQAALRIKGGIFSKISDFPVVAVVRCDETPTGSSVVIRSLDDLGIGLKIGMQKKYSEAVRVFGEMLAQMVDNINTSH